MSNGHKYLMRVLVNGKYRYFYTPAEVSAYNKHVSGQVDTKLNNKTKPNGTKVKPGDWYRDKKDSKVKPGDWYRDKKNSKVKPGDWYEKEKQTKNKKQKTIEYIEYVLAKSKAKNRKHELAKEAKRSNKK